MYKKGFQFIKIYDTVELCYTFEKVAPSWIVSDPLRGLSSHVQFVIWHLELPPVPYATH